MNTNNQRNSSKNNRNYRGLRESDLPYTIQLVVHVELNMDAREEHLVEKVEITIE
jgi:hypothetical protein